MIKFYGYSDDFVVVEGDVRGEIGDGVEVRIGTEEAGIVVSMHYSDTGDHVPAVWQARVRQIDEDKPIPWPIRIEAPPPNGHPASVYSVAVVVDCPLGTPSFVSTGKQLQ